MLCQHLRGLEAALQAAGVAETYRGQAWSENCREWAYFDCVLDRAAIEARFELVPPVAWHSNEDPKSGREAGFACAACHDAVMGRHPLDRAGKRVFPTAESGG